MTRCPKNILEPERTGTRVQKYARTNQKSTCVPILAQTAGKTTSDDIPCQCLEEITEEPSMKRKYEIAVDKVAYVRDAVTNKQCKAMSQIQEVCASKYVYSRNVSPK